MTGRPAAMPAAVPTVTPAAAPTADARADAPVESPGAVASVADEVLLARAYLNAVAEPAHVALWAFVRERGPVLAAARIRDRRDLPEAVAAATEARYASVDPHAQLDAGHRAGARLIAPESPEWPHFAMACLEHAGLARLADFEAAPKLHAEKAEPVPPLALWVRGPLEVSTLATRSVALVGSRAASAYGSHVAQRLAARLAGHDVVVVSGGAFGIDVAAHRGALAAGGGTVLVSAGGVDTPYPPSHAALFDAVADTGLLVSESPPGAAAYRHRFLSRNRLIAALSAGTVVVEAALRSGALNTVSHCRRLGRPVMVVPGSVESAMSAGCHAVLRDERRDATLVTGAADVLEVVGAGSGWLQGPDTGEPAGDDPSPRVRRRRALDQVDARCRTVFDGFPADRAVHTDELVRACGLPVREVLRALPSLELAGLVEATEHGYRIRP